MQATATALQRKLDDFQMLMEIEKTMSDVHKELLASLDNVGQK